MSERGFAVTCCLASWLTTSLLIGAVPWMAVAATTLFVLWGDEDDK